MAPSPNKLNSDSKCAISSFLECVAKYLFLILWCALHIESFSHSKNRNSLHMFDWNILEREVGFISPSCPDLAQISCPQGKSNSSSVEDALCRCDEECFQFGDCCFDYARQLRRTSFESQMRCSSWNDQHNLFTVDDCPPGFTDEALSLKCQKNQSDSSFTYLMDLGVISAATQRAYANVFCAICHSDSTNLEPFHGLIRCDKQNIIDECGISIQDQILTRSNYNPGTRSWTLQFGSDLGAIPNCTNGISYLITCKLFIQRKALGDSKEFKPSRTCPHAGTIGTCDVKKALAKKSVLPVDVERFQHFCKLYTLLVVFEGKIYKNPHCAVCNGIPLNRTRCISKTDLPISSIQTSPSDQHLNIPSNRTIYFAFSKNYNNSCVDSLNHCGNESDQVHDFIHNKPYNIRCGFLYQNEGGECVIRNFSLSQLTEGKDGRCYLKTLEQWELQGVVAIAKAAGKSHAFPVEIGLLDVMLAPFPSLSPPPPSLLVGSSVPLIETFFLDEFANGSILHKQTKLVYKIGEYNIFYIGNNLTQRRYQVCFEDPPLFEYDPTQAQVFTITSWVSLVALAYHIVVFTSLKRLRNQPAQNLLALACSLFITQLLLVLALDYHRSHSICMFTSSCLHFFSLVAVFWLNVLSFDICRVFAQSWNARTVFEVPNPKARKLADKKRLKYYSIYAWGIPVIIVTCGHCLDMLDGWLRFYRPKYAIHMCWINNPNGFVLFFALPACSLFLENLVIFLIALILALTRRRDLQANDTQITVQPIQPSVALTKKSKKGLKEDKKPSETATKDRLRRTGATAIQALHVTGVKFKITQHLRAYEMRKARWRFGSYVVLAVVMTGTWTMLCALIYLRQPIFIYPFAILNGLQGVIIFFLFDLKPKIYFLAFEKIVGRPHPNYKKRRLQKLKLDKSDLKSASISRAGADSTKLLQSVDDAENQKIGREAIASKSSEQVANETPASMSIRKAKKKQWQGRSCSTLSTGSPKQKSQSSTKDNEVNNHEEGDALSNSEKFQDRNLSLSIDNVPSSKSRKTISRRKRSKSAPPKKGPRQTANTTSRTSTTTPTNTPVTGRSQKDANRGGHALGLFKRKPKADSYLFPPSELQKVKSEKSCYKKSKTDLAKYDAWQQLKIFQRSLSLEPNQEQTDSEPIFQPLCQGNDGHKSANEHLQTQADKRSDKDESAERVERSPRSQKTVAKLQRQFSFDKGSSISIGSSFQDDDNHVSLASSATQHLPKDHTRWKDLVVVADVQAKFLDCGTQTKLRKAQKRSRANAKVDSFMSSRRHKSCSAMVDFEEDTTHDASCQTWTRDRVNERESFPISAEYCTKKSSPQVQREKSYSAIFKMSTTSSGSNSARNLGDGKMMTTRVRTRKTGAQSAAKALHDRQELGRPTSTQSLSFDASTDSIYPDSLNWNNDSADLGRNSRANLVQSDTDISDTEVRAKNTKSEKPLNGLSGFKNNEFFCEERIIKKLGTTPSKFQYIWKPPPRVLPESQSSPTNLKRLERRVMGVQIVEKGRSNHETKPLRGCPSALTETEEGPNGPSLTNSKNCLLRVVPRPSMEHQVQRRRDEKAFPFSPEAIKHDYSSNLKPEGGFTRAPREEPTLGSDLSMPRTVPEGHADHFNGEATVFLCPPAYQTLPPKKHPPPPPYCPPPAYQPTTKANPIVLNQERRPVNPAFSLCPSEYVDCSSLDMEHSQEDNGHGNSTLYVTGHPEQGQESVV